MNNEIIDAMRQVIQEEIGSRLDTLENKFDLLADKVNKLADKVNKLDDKVNKLADKVNKLDDKVNELDGKVNTLSTEFVGMKERQDEMYTILKGMEEFIPVTNSRLDSLEVDVAKMKHHKHDILIETNVAEMVREE